MSSQPSDGRRGGGWVLGQFVFGAVVVGAGFVGSGWPSPVRVVLTIAGIALGALGAAMLVAGGAHLGSSLTPYPRPTPEGSLREGGVYRIVRHPMYGGVLLIAVGWSLIATPLALAAFCVFAVFFELKSRREEAWLLERYPAYAAYGRRTRWKFLPGVR